MGHMSTNAVLAYLDSFQPISGRSGTPPFFNRDLTEQTSLEGLLNEIKQKAVAQDDHAQREAAEFFAPYGLRHPQLIILLETLRCKIREEVNQSNFSEEAKAILNAAMVLTTLLDVVSRECMSNPYPDETVNFGGCDFIRLKDSQNPFEFYQYGYKLKNRTGIIQADDQDLYQVTLVEKSLYNELWQVPLHAGKRYKVIKKSSENSEEIASFFEAIKKGQSRSAISSELSAVVNFTKRRCSTNRKQELRAVFKSKLGVDLQDCDVKDYETKPSTFISWLCMRIQAIFIEWNDLRLGGLRGRRLSVFIGNLLVAVNYSKQYGEAWRNAHNWLESQGVLFLFANVGWLFFLPRLLRNLCVLFYHVLSDLFYDSKLSPIEAAMDRTTRFRIHWMRCWDEVINDSYWLANGLAFRFLFYGVVSSTTIQINLLTQVADLLNAGIRATLLIRRLSTLETDLITHQMPLSLHGSLRERINFEQQFLLYTVFHFVVLLAAMLMTLPSAAAISPLLPVIGAVCAVLMTIVTWWIRSSFQIESQKRFQQESLNIDEPKLAESPMRLNSSFFG